MLRAGMCVFHNGIPVVLLYHQRTDKEGEFWRVRTTYVYKPVDRDELFKPGDRVVKTHGYSCPEVSAHRSAH